MEESYIAITAKGGYPSYDFRNAMIDSIVTAASYGQTWWNTSVEKITGDQHFVNGQQVTDYENVVIWQGYGTDWWMVEIYDNNDLVGSITAYASQPNFEATDQGLVCQQIVPDVTEGVSVINGELGGILGIIGQAACDTSQGAGSDL